MGQYRTVNRECVGCREVDIADGDVEIPGIGNHRRRILSDCRGKLGRAASSASLEDGQRGSGSQRRAHDAVCGRGPEHKVTKSASKQMTDLHRSLGIPQGWITVQRGWSPPRCCCWRGERCGYPMTMVLTVHYPNIPFYSISILSSSMPLL